jgi:pimeloyl-ACP methyl ester carboxylesterase
MASNSTPSIAAKLQPAVPSDPRQAPANDWRRAFAGLPAWAGLQLAEQAFDYWVDACQRSVLLLDVMRQRGNSHFEHIAQRTPNVLNFKFELVMSGRALERPVNYGLLRIVPPADVKIDPRKRPFIVFDPRAGHGPGIGGMKHDSEIGVALANGHSCYFVGFVPDPISGQTVEDVCHAEALFVRKVVERHPESEGKPCLIGNCQAGWQIMMMAATEPDLVGPLVLAGSPLSYWAGVHGKNPMRYLGGLLGGTWLTSLTGDLGHGIFDGAYLVTNFENLNPANTYWQKTYNVYSRVDTEAPRYLEFEKWWGSPVLLNAAEMQYIADELFVGNRLTSGEIYTSEDVRIDLRNIKSPIIVFCSWGDNITPPQQALHWILDLYESDDDLAAGGQTIVYALHQSIGHLGIFVSAKVATKEHEEFTQAMDLIDVLPPGLYEAVITEKGPDTIRPELVAGNYLVRFEARSLSDIRAIGGNDAEDDLRFATVARVSEINQGLYRSCLSPIVRSVSTDQTAEWLRDMHPHRIRYGALSDRNPLMRPVGELADLVRANRRPVDRENPFVALQEAVSQQIVDALDTYRDTRDRLLEAAFMMVYGSPLLQAMVGLRSDAATARRSIGRDLAREAAAAKLTAELKERIERGGLREAVVRALIYIALGRAEPSVDERCFAVLRQFRADQPGDSRMTLAEFKEMVREQYLLLRIDEQRAMAALPTLLAGEATDRSSILELIRRIVWAAGDPSIGIETRFKQVEALLEGRSTAALPGPAGEAWKVVAASSLPASRASGKSGRKDARDVKVRGSPDQA